MGSNEGVKKEGGLATGGGEEKVGLVQLGTECVG